MVELLFSGPYAPFFWLAASAAIVVCLERLLPEMVAARVVLRRWVLGAGLWALGLLFYNAMLSGIELVWGERQLDGSSLQGSWLWQGVLALLLVDLLHYWFHRLLHSVPALWRVHAVHHGDRSYDAATSLRFHPAETALHAAAVYVLFRLAGVGEQVALALAAFLTLWNVLQHGNFRSPARFSAIARIFFVTPDLHRTHHARDLSLRDKNFGLVFTLWDRLFGTFSPVADPTTAVGVEGFDASEDVLENLVAPFARAR